MPRVSHFELAYDDPEKGAQFYQKVFDWKVEKWGGGEQEYWLITTGPDSEVGINGGIMAKMPNMSQPVINTLTVSDIDAYSQKVLDNGGKEALAKMPIPQMGYVAYFIDPQGIVFGIFQEDEAAT